MRGPFPPAEKKKVEPPMAPADKNGPPKTTCAKAVGPATWLIAAKIEVGVPFAEVLDCEKVPANELVCTVAIPVAGPMGPATASLKENAAVAASNNAPKAILSFVKPMMRMARPLLKHLGGCSAFFSKPHPPFGVCGSIPIPVNYDSD